MIVGTAYSYGQYALESYIDPLLAKGYIDFHRHDYLTPQQFDYELARHRPDLFESEDERLEIVTRFERKLEFEVSEQSGQRAFEFAA